MPNAARRPSQPFAITRRTGTNTGGNRRHIHGLTETAEAGPDSV